MPISLPTGSVLKCVAVNRVAKLLNSPIVTYSHDMSTVLNLGKRIAPSDIKIISKKVSGEDLYTITFESNQHNQTGDNLDFIYTLDGSDPIIGSTMWNRRPVLVKVPAYIKVRTLKPGLKLGKVIEKKIVPKQLSVPTLNIPSETTFTNLLKLRFNTTQYGKENVEILYTLNGDDPYENGIKYENEIVIDSSSTIRAIAQAPGFRSSVERVFKYYKLLGIKSSVDSIIAIHITNNPFIPDITKLPTKIIESLDFSVEYGTAIIAKPLTPSVGYGTIFDALGNVIKSRTEMNEDSENKNLYLVWDGKNSYGKNVAVGSYLAIISIEDRVSGKTFMSKAFISVAH